ncbi:MAG TPA: hypothetical protein VHC70_08250 [Phycisphaerales bacterium]|jgi:hypothetical protein|nr:hypothetical protein [Phycisphaerales bacterium]
MLNLDSRSKSKLLWIGTLLTPAIAVQIVRFMIGGGPADASAATTPAPLPITAAAPENARPLSTAQAKAVGWLLSRKQTLGLRSPMDYPDALPEPSAEPPPQERPAPPVATASGPSRAPGSLTITALMSGGSPDDSIVSINHKLYHVGDEIVPHWKILGIDVPSRTVTISGPEGQSIELSLAIAEN